MGNPLFLAALAILSAGMWLLFNAHSPANLLHGTRYWFEIPVVWLPAVFLCAVLPAAMTQGSVALRLTAGLTAVIFAAIYAVIGVLVGDAGRFTPNSMFPTGPAFLNWSLHENWAELALATVGGLLTTFALCQSEVIDTPFLRSAAPVEPPKPAEDTKSTERTAKTTTEKLKEPEQSELTAALKAGGLGKTLGKEKEKEKEKEEEGPGLSGLLDRLDPEVQQTAAATPTSAKSNSPSAKIGSAASTAPPKSSTAAPKTSNGAAKSSTPASSSKPSTTSGSSTTSGANASSSSSKSSAPSSTPAGSSSTAPVAKTSTPSSTDKPAEKTSDKKPTTPTSTATRLQAQKRKSTSTFTKLQALSASGTSGTAARKADSEESDSLKSILDRLDTRIDEYEDDILSPNESLMPQHDVMELDPEPPDLSAIGSSKAKTDSKTQSNREVESAARDIEEQLRQESLLNKAYDSSAGVPSLSAMLDAMDNTPADTKKTVEASTSSTSSPPPSPPPVSETAYGFTAEDLIAIKTPKISTGGLSGLKDKSTRSGKDFLKKDSARNDGVAAQSGDHLSDDEGMLQEELMLPDESLVSDTLQLSPDNIDNKAASPTGVDATTASSTEPSSVTDPLDFAPDSALKESLEVAGVTTPETASNDLPTLASEIDLISQAAESSSGPPIIDAVSDDYIEEATASVELVEASSVEVTTTPEESVAAAEATSIDSAAETPATEVTAATEAAPEVETATATEAPAAETATATESPAAETATATESPAAETATATESPATETATATESPATETATATESPAAETATASETSGSTTETEAPAAETSPAEAASPSAASEIESNLFTAQAIDNIFSSLEPESQNAPSLEAPWVAAFEATVDEEPAPSVEEPAPSVEELQKVENVFGTEVDQDVDDLFSSIVPEDAQKEVKDSTYKAAYGATESSALEDSTSTDTPAVEAKTEGAETIAESPAVETPAETETKAESSSAEEPKSDNVFGQEIDKDIDDLFSSIVPEEAQKEVRDSGYSKAYGEGVEPQSPEKADESRVEEPKAEASKVEEVEATKAEQPNVESAEPIAAEATEPVKVDNVFGSEIDQDIDDLFSAIVPEGAQKEVKDSGYKAAYGEKPSEKAADETLSFAPPSEPAAPDVVTPAPAEEPVSEATAKEASDQTPPLQEQLPTGKELADLITNPNLIKGQAGRFNQTLAHLPSLQGTVEGLLNNLASFESKEVKKEPSESPSSKNAAADLIESLMPAAEPKEADTPSEPIASEQPQAEVTEETPKIEPEETKAAEPPKRVEEARVAEPSKPVEETKATEPPAEVAEPSKPAVEVEASEPPKPVVEVKAAEPPKPAAEVKAAEPPKPAAEVKAAEPPKPAAEVKAAEPPKPAAEVKAAEPPKPAAVKAPDAPKPAEVKAPIPPTKTDTFSAEPPKPVVAKPADVNPVGAAPAIAASDTRGKEIEAPATVHSGPDVGQSLKDADKKPASEVEKQLKEFGRLSSKSATAPISDAPPGTMKTIGKLLIEVQAVENIIKTGETTGKLGSGLTTARVISAARGEGIRALLAKIDEYSNVVGSIIVGHDGLVIASTVPAGMDKDTLGALSLACIGTSNLSTKKLEIGTLQQMVMITDKFVTIITDVNVGILVVFMDSVVIDKIDGAIEAIHDTVAGG